MKKIVFGNPKPSMNPPKLDTTPVVSTTATMEYLVRHSTPASDDAVVRIPYVNQEPTKETVIVETRTQVLKESRDKWARKHSKLSTKKMEKIVDELLETLNQQNERIHYMQHQIQGLVETADRQARDITTIGLEKPKEIPVVTERVVVEKHIPKKLAYALLASVILNGIILALK